MLKHPTEERLAALSLTDMAKALESPIILDRSIAGVPEVAGAFLGGDGR
jgi:hypothetical protein